VQFGLNSFGPYNASWLANELPLQGNIEDQPEAEGPPNDSKRMLLPEFAPAAPCSSNTSLVEPFALSNRRPALEDSDQRWIVDL
jgi:hypothetical protein